MLTRHARLVYLVLFQARSANQNAWSFHSQTRASRSCFARLTRNILNLRAFFVKASNLEQVPTLIGVCHQFCKLAKTCVGRDGKQDATKNTLLSPTNMSNKELMMFDVVVSLETTRKFDAEIVLVVYRSFGG